MASLRYHKLSSKWKEIFNDYILGEKLGEGTYGTVMKGVCRATNQDVAIKFIDGFAHHDYELVKVLREIQILRVLNKLMP
jgi:serine/threonine protein kinase